MSTLTSHHPRVLMKFALHSYTRSLITCLNPYFQCGEATQRRRSGPYRLNVWRDVGGQDRRRRRRRSTLLCVMKTGAVVERNCSRYDRRTSGVVQPEQSHIIAEVSPSRRTPAERARLTHSCKPIAVDVCSLDCSRQTPRPITADRGGSEPPGIPQRERNFGNLAELGPQIRRFKLSEYECSSPGYWKLYVLLLLLILFYIHLYSHKLQLQLQLSQNLPDRSSQSFQG